MGAIWSGRPNGFEAHSNLVTAIFFTCGPLHMKRLSDLNWPRFQKNEISHIQSTSNWFAENSMPLALSGSRSIKSRIRKPCSSDADFVSVLPKERSALLKLRTPPGISAEHWQFLLGCVVRNNADVIGYHVNLCPSIHIELYSAEATSRLVALKEFWLKRVKCRSSDLI